MSMFFMVTTLRALQGNEGTLWSLVRAVTHMPGDQDICHYILALIEKLR